MGDHRGAAERPSPEALLEEAKRAEKGRRGRLKIFVGAAPGVGKTYEMLQSARAKIKEGVDVVAGVVETHGREETEALLEGLEVLPRKPTIYVNRILDEFDLETALKRRPSLILIDELAHTNIPGSRHPKRYLDVEELLNAGIDVYTTVNIQHIESLNDVVAQITRVRVRETVPDEVIDNADAIELVDLTPDDLIQRLREGRVYVPKQAERALKHFFSPANLTALRELALRRTAERVDEQLLEHMQARAISGPWPAGERILVCISEDPRSAALVRYAKRLADRLHAPWTALYLETSRSLHFAEDARDSVADTLRLAGRLEGEAIKLPAKARRLADDIIAFAQRNNATHIVIGKSKRTRWFEILNGSAPHRTILCEYHAAGAATGAFMIRKGSYKYVYYVGMPPQLFDLDLDPQEERDLGQDPRYSGVASDCETLLRRVVDPEAADRQAFADQAARIDQLGGRDAVLARGGFGFSPVPGAEAVYSEMQTQRRS